MVDALVSACAKNFRVWEHFLNGIAETDDRLKG